VKAILLFNCYSAAERNRMLLSLSHQQRNTHPNLPSFHSLTLKGTETTGVFQVRVRFRFQGYFTTSFPVPKGGSYSFIQLSFRCRAVSDVTISISSTPQHPSQPSLKGRSFTPFQVQVRVRIRVRVRVQLEFDFEFDFSFVFIFRFFPRP
jgi:hypothetical protein